jgi:hypothetical protein
MISREIIIAVIMVLGGGGLITAFVALLKLRPEAGQIMVTTAQGVVIVQTGVIESLQKELKRVSDELDEVRRDNVGLRARIRELEGKPAI